MFNIWCQDLYQTLFLMPCGILQFLPIAVRGIVTARNAIDRGLSIAMSGDGFLRLMA